MSFRVWFRLWIGSFVGLLAVSTKKRKSEAQRKKEKERRLRAKYSSAKYYRGKKQRRRRRSSHSVQNQRLISAMLSFMAISLGVLLLPFGLFDWGRKSVKARKASDRGNGSKKDSPKSSAKSKDKTTASKTRKTVTNTAKKNTNTQRPRAVAKIPQPQSISNTPIGWFESSSSDMTAVTIEPSSTEESDEITPKSKPKNENDRYIRKRMIIAGSYYCDKAVLENLQVGSYVDLESEPENPYDEDAVKLMYHGQKIGYIAKKDRSAFVTCLKLKRKIYGVITEIQEEDGQTKYEYETWFENR